MHPRDYANLALTASAVADSEGFSFTARAFEMLAAATLLEDRTNTVLSQARRVERLFELANAQGGENLHT